MYIYLQQSPNPPSPPSPLRPQQRKAAGGRWEGLWRWQYKQIYFEKAPQLIDISLALEQLYALMLLCSFQYQGLNYFIEVRLI